MSDPPIPEAAAELEASPSRWGRALGEPGPDQQEAFGELAESYWYCVYAWWRRAGIEAADAAPATRAAFTQWFGAAPPRPSDSGAARMREWVVARLAELAQQGGELEGETELIIDPAWAERRYADEPPGEPDAIFQRRWAITVIEFTASSLRAEYVARGEEALFAELVHFAGFEPGDDERYAEAAVRTGQTSGAMRKAVFDFRTRQRELLHAFVSDTLLDSAEIAGEISSLLCACDSPGPDPVGAPLPSALRSVRPDEVLARAMQSVRISHVTPGGWQPPTVREASRLFPQYEIHSLLGRGGMGAVYRARQLELDRLVAIKLLPLEVSVNRDFADRFRREARAMAKLNHPNIISVHDFGMTREGHLYFVMEFVEGANLHQMIHGPGLSPAQALETITGVCEALTYAHGKGIIHRDIKPANVMVSLDGQVKVADFGLARLSDSGDQQFGHTVTGTVMGTADYMAPEQMHGMSVDQRADIYSLGVMLYEMLCGEVPHGIFDPPSVRVSGIDSRLDQVVNKAMAQQPDRRYQSTQEMKTDVAAARLPVLAARPPVKRPPPPRPKPVGIWIAACAALLVAGLFAVKPRLLFPQKGATPIPESAQKSPDRSGTPAPAPGVVASARPSQPDQPKPDAVAVPDSAATPKPVGAGPDAQIPPVPGTPAPAAATPQPLPLSATGKWLAEQEPQWQAAFAREVREPFEKGAGDLKQRYLASLAAQFAAATRASQLDAAVAFRDEQKLLEDGGGGVPAADEPDLPPTLKSLRTAYRKSFAALDAERVARSKILQARYDAILAQNQALLTQRQRVDEALEIKAERKQLADAWLEPPASAVEAPPAAPAKDQVAGSPLDQAATPGRDESAANPGRTPVKATFPDAHGHPLPRFVWKGTRSAIYTVSHDLDRRAMGDLVNTLDKIYQYYAEVGAREAEKDPASGNRGVVVEDESLGSDFSADFGKAVIRMSPGAMRKFCTNGVQTEKPDAGFFWAIGVNTWCYKKQLTPAGADYGDGFFKGYARFMAIAAVQSTGVKPLRGKESAAEKSEEALLDSYIANRRLTFANTLGAAKAARDPMAPDNADLFAAFFLHLSRENGGTTFTRSLWREVLRRPETATAQDGIDNLILSACAAAGKNLSTLFTTRWRWPMSESALSEAKSRWGEPPLD